MARAVENRPYEEQCKGKYAFRTKREAKVRLKRMTMIRRGDLQPYRCPHCNGWHLGHKKMRPKKDEEVSK